MANNNSADIAIDIAPFEIDEAPIEAGSSTQLVRWLCSVSFFTLLMVVATAIYKPPEGVVFEHHRIAYYLTLSGIFAAGLAELWAAIWLSSSSSGQDNGRRRGYARAALWASVVPLVVIVALGGYSVLVKG